MHSSLICFKRLGLSGCLGALASLAFAENFLPPTPSMPDLPTFDSKISIKPEPGIDKLPEQQGFVLTLYPAEPLALAQQKLNAFRDQKIPAQLKKTKEGTFVIVLGPEIQESRLKLLETQVNLDPKTVKVEPFIPEESS